MRCSVIPVASCSVSERLGDQLVLQYSAVDLMNCWCMVVVVSLLCPNSWPVMAFRALNLGVHLCLMPACYMFFECQTVVICDS